MRVELNALTLKNFKGIRDLTLSSLYKYKYTIN